MVENSDDIRFAARIFLHRYKNKSCQQAVLRAIELEHAGSQVSKFWRAVALELKDHSSDSPECDKK